VSDTDARLSDSAARRASPAEHVRKNALQHLHQEITITSKQGSFTLEESLADLVRRELIERPEALARAGHPGELERLLDS